MKKQLRRSSPSQLAADIWRSLLKLGFGLLYNQMAWSYDSVSWMVSRGQWRLWQRTALPYLHGETILELAHGPGHMLLALQEAGYNVIGLDLSPSMGRLARRRTKHAGNRIALVRANGQSLPFARNSFDSILSTFPTEFLARPETIGGIYGVLKPGGRLVVVPQAQLRDDSALTRFIEWLYAITGQRPDSSTVDRNEFWQAVNERFRNSGFVLNVEQVNLEASNVTVVVAEKPLVCQ